MGTIMTMTCWSKIIQVPIAVAEVVQVDITMMI
jgi:hypothetical protein